MLGLGNDHSRDYICIQFGPGGNLVGRKEEIESISEYCPGATIYPIQTRELFIVQRECRGLQTHTESLPA